LVVNVSGKALLMESAAEYRASLILTDPKGYSVISPSQNANLGSDIKVAVR
jgi:hypothetical protein